MAKDGK
jgi:chromosome segregation ATPase